MEPRMRRWSEQRWTVDNLIRANGIDWDQPRTANLVTACGAESLADITAIRSRVQKFADIGPAFEAAARRREAKARAAEADGALVTARDNYFMAAQYWASAQWPLLDNDEVHLRVNRSKRDCFAAYARLADHRVEAAWIPLPDGRRLPGWLHLPPGAEAARVPAVVSIPGMDGFKERSVALYGDRWLARGFAVLAVEGPGQYECPTLGLYVSVPAWAETGRACFEWLAARPEIDARRIGIIGSSFGSLFTTIAAGAEPRYAAAAVVSTCLEPGCHSIFEEASPTFKRRFMYMAGMTDEAQFDAFRATLTWEGYAEKIRMPYLCLAGEADELSPLAHAERMFQVMTAPRRLVVYAESRHSVGNVPATNLGPAPGPLMADWMADRMAGRPLASERWTVEASGRVVQAAL